MASKVLSAAVIGLDAELVEVEADTGGGEIGSFAIVGLPDASVSESRERVRSAIRNSELEFPRLKVTVNLAPADLKKQGPSYDLPIAVSVLAATGKLPSNRTFDSELFVGELALDGGLRPVNGILPIAILAKERGIREVYVPAANAYEAKTAGDITVFPVTSLKDLYLHFIGRKLIAPLESADITFQARRYLFDLAHIKGQEHVKRAMEIAAAGAHNMLMSGSPGAGKTLIARTMPSILPDLTIEESLEITKIYSVAGLLSGGTALVSERPFRSPHHTASGVALVGGGAWPRPGEISLAHRGVLFLDEFAEFPRSVLENLRQPLEEGYIHVSRAAGNLRFPAKFILIAAMNPCPCGFTGDKERACQCSPSQISNYKKRISGPIIDRIDLHVEVPRVAFDHLVAPADADPSSAVKEKVEKARVAQRERFKGEPFKTNSEMTSEAVKRYCPTDQRSRELLRSAVEQLKLSARSYFRILKLARTIADLEGRSAISYDNISEALAYRPKAD